MLCLQVSVTLFPYINSAGLAVISGSPGEVGLIWCWGGGRRHAYYFTGRGGGGQRDGVSSREMTQFRTRPGPGRFDCVYSESMTLYIVNRVTLVIFSGFRPIFFVEK